MVVPRGAICFLVGAIHQNDACRIPSRVEELKRMELILYRISWWKRRTRSPFRVLSIITLAAVQPVDCAPAFSCVRNPGCKRIVYYIIFHHRCLHLFTFLIHRLKADWKIPHKRTIFKRLVLVPDLSTCLSSTYKFGKQGNHPLTAIIVSVFIFPMPTHPSNDFFYITYTVNTLRR